MAVFLVQAVGQGSGRGLVDDTHDFQACNASGVLGGLTLGVGEVSGHGDDGLGYGLAQIALGVRLQLLQDHGADFLRGVLFAVDGHFLVGAHLPFDGSDGAVRILDGLVLGHAADQTLAVLVEADDGGSSAAAFRIGDNDGFAAFHNGDAAVGGTKVNTDNLAHDDSSCFYPCKMVVFVMICEAENRVQANS